MRLPCCDPNRNGESFLLTRLSKQWKLCFDIGANVGDYAMTLRNANPDCRVVCFEPNPDLGEKIRAKGFEEIYHSAVGRETGTITINVDMNNSTQSSIYRTPVSCKRIAVPVITLDDFVEKQGIEHIDFVKIDTEGAEVDILHGARNLLARQAIDLIQFEYGGTYLDAHVTLQEIYGLLAEHYLICHIYPEGILPYTFNSELETYRYSNWLAVSRTYGLVTG